MTARERERLRLIAECDRLIAEYHAYHRDVEQWNALNPHEKPIEPDPQGEMERVLFQAKRTKRHLEQAT